MWVNVPEEEMAGMGEERKSPGGTARVSRGTPRDTKGHQGQPAPAGRKFQHCSRARPAAAAVGQQKKLKIEIKKRRPRERIKNLMQRKNSQENGNK